MINASTQKLFSSADVDFLCGMLDFYADIGVESEGAGDALGLWSSEISDDRMSVRSQYILRVNSIIDCLRNRIVLRQTDLWVIHSMLLDAIESHDTHDGREILYSEEHYAMATTIRQMIEMSADSYELPVDKATILLADALEGHFGASPNILSKLGDVRDYTNSLGFYTNSLGLANAVAMVLCSTRDVRDSRVEAMAEDICMNIPD